MSGQTTRVPTRLLMPFLFAAVLMSPVDGRAADKVSIQTAFMALADYGGFYQAHAKGIYAKHGLEVDIRQGGPMQDAAQMLMAGRVDFIVSNSLAALNYAREGLPFLAVATTYQRDPQVILAHKGSGNERLADLKGKPIFVGATARVSFWPLLRAKLGFADEQIRPFTGSYAPFLNNPQSGNQAFWTTMPMPSELSGGIALNAFPLYDLGWFNYAQTLNTSQRLVDTKPDVVRRFIVASAEGWRSYLNEDPSPANVIIKKENPGVSDERLAFAIKAIKDRGLVEGDDAQTMGIGAMTDKRWNELYQSTVELGINPAGLDYKRAYTLRFLGDQK